MYLKRDIESCLLRLAEQFECITVYGARQVGKSTTVRKVFGDAFEYVTLDDYDELNLALNDPKGFLEVHEWPLVIDEIQKAPLLLSYIKILIDEKRYEWLVKNERHRLMFILTGSNQFELRQGISESLAGRTAMLNMSSMTNFEVRGLSGAPFDPDIDKMISKVRKSKDLHLSKSNVFEMIFAGGMPGFIAEKTDRDVFFKSYFDTYIEKDIRGLVSAGNEMQFRRFVSYLALRTAQQVSYESFSSDLGISSETCRRWIDIMISSGIIVLLEPFMTNLSKRIIKSPKLYFMDTGFCAYLCKWPNAAMLEDCAMSGAFFETYVVSEIIKGFYNAGTRTWGTLYYYRDVDHKEIDLIYSAANVICPIEIKKGELPSKPHKNFKVLEKYKLDVGPGLVIDNCDSIRPIGDNVFSFPVSLLGL